MARKPEPDTTTDAGMAEHLKAGADRLAEREKPDNARANLERTMHGEPDFGRQPSGRNRIMAWLKRWRF